MNGSLFTPELVPVYTERQRQILNNATPENVKAGLAWYQDAHDISEDVAQRTGVPGIVVRRILSKISPRNRWESTPEQAESLILRGMDAKIGTTNTLKAMAYQMVQDHQLHLFDYRQAPKTYCFTENMDKPKERRVIETTLNRRPVVVPVVTCDRHTIISFGLPFSPNGKGENSQISLSQYVYLSLILDNVSREFGWLPQEAQAIGWLEQRQGLVAN